MSQTNKNSKLLSYLNTKQVLLFGTIPLLFGMLTLVGWVFRIPNLTSFIPNAQYMVISTALMLTIVGTTLVYLHFNLKYATKITRVVGTIIMLTGMIIIIESIFDYSWIDFNHLHSSTNTLLHAGRMSPHTAICFVLLGLLFCLTDVPRKTILTIIHHSVYLILFLLSMMGIASYVVNLEFIYSFFEYNRMSLPTALAIFFAGLALIKFKKNQYSQLDKSTVEVSDIYNVTSLMIVIIVTSVAVFSFALSQNRIEQTMKEQLTEIAGDRRAYFATVINLKTEAAKVNADRPLLAQAIIKNFDNISTRNITTKMLTEYLNQGFSGLALEDNLGNTIAQVGKFTKNPELIVPINSPLLSQLLWKDGYILTSRVPMLDFNGKTLAFMRSEQKLNELTAFHQNVLSRGETTDLVVCGLENDNQICFPFRWSPKPKVVYGYLDDKPLPITRAVKGEINTLITTDFRRERVMAAFGPIGTTGLGMAIKIDMREQYSPIRAQFISALPFYLLLITLSMLLMWFKLKPIVHALDENNTNLNNLANYDSLTLLPNRLLFNDRLETAILRDNREQGALALLYLDVDYFKTINDSYGHKTGDAVLQWLAIKLKNAVRETDTVARLGGDEFTIILENLSNPQDAKRLAESIIQSVSLDYPPLENNKLIKITLSIGIAIHHESSNQVDFLEQADSALYEAKRAGRNTYHMFESESTGV